MMKKKQMSIEECMKQIKRGLDTTYDAAYILHSQYGASIELLTDDASIELEDSPFIKVGIIFEIESDESGD